MTTHDCPTDDRLRAFDRGAVSADELDTIAGHLGRCARCIERLAGLAAPIGACPVGVAELPEDGEYLRAVALIATCPVSGARLPEVGDTLRDYRLVANLGQGGMGTVFKAVHTKLDKVVAVKVLSGRRWNDPGAAARFEREMKAVGRLDHPNIVKANDAGDADGVPFLVMEFIDGETLSALVRRDGPLPLPRACALVRQAAVGLHHAHRAGIVHRDVKPSNLMLTRAGEVKVLDLGLALPLAPPVEAATTTADTTAAGPTAGNVTASGSRTDGGSDLTSPDHTVGTADYMAPEQKRNAHTVDARADVYGLGCTLWFLLTGRPPRAGEVVRAKEYPGNLPAKLWRKFLAADPADRFADAAAAAAELEHLTRPARLPTRRAWFAIAGGAVATAVTAGVISRLRARRSPDPAVLVRGGPVVPSGPPPGKLPMTHEKATALQQRWADYLGRPVTHRGPLGIKFALIPPGTLGLSTECQVAVTRPYYLATCEITVGQFRAFVEKEKYETVVERNKLGGSYFDLTAADRDFFKRRPSFVWREPGYSVVTDDHPVTQVEWEDATAFCKWLSGGRAGPYRLPTEAEWAWAARAGSIDISIHKAGDPIMQRYAWLRQNSAKPPHPPQPQPVGTLKPNVWGLFDTMGNASEICHDFHGDLPVSEEPVVDYKGKDTHAHGWHVIMGSPYYSVAAALAGRGALMYADAAIGFRILYETH